MADQLTCPIADVKLLPLNMHRDLRGAFTEVFRANWDNAIQAVQWSVVRSGFNVVRGMHAHVSHVDYIVSVAGPMCVGLSDLREESPTFRTGCLLELDSACLTGVEIPPGVAHGFYFPSPNVHLHAASEYYDPADDINCRWTDPDLNIPWPRIVDPVVAPRDRQNGSVADLIEKRRQLLTAARRMAA